MTQEACQSYHLQSDPTPHFLTRTSTNPGIELLTTGNPAIQTHDPINMAGGDGLVAENEAGDLWVVDGGGELAGVEKGNS